MRGRMQRVGEGGRGGGGEMRIWNLEAKRRMGEGDPLDT